MSYSNYLNKLHFGSVSDGIQGMKENEMNRLTNPLEAKSLGLDSDITSLTSVLQGEEAQDAVSKTIDTAVTGAGGAVEGMATMKKLYSKFKEKASDKVDELKGKAQDAVDELKGKAEDLKGQAQDKVDDLKGQAQDQVDGLKGETKTSEPDGESPDEFAYSSDNPGVPQANAAQRGEAEAADDDDIVDGPSELNEVTSTDLAPTTTDIPTTELGSGTITNTAPAGTGEGSIEMQTFDSNVPDDVPSGFTGTGDAADHNAELAESDPDQGRALESQLDDLTTEEQSASNTLSSDTSAIDGLAEGAEGAVEGAADIGVDVAEGAGEAALEAGGAALDATGIGAVVGILMNIGGIVMGAVQGSEDATKDTSTENDIAADQQQVDQIKQQELTIKSQIANQTFTGANIVPNISSTTMNNVTSSSF